MKKLQLVAVFLLVQAIVLLGCSVVTETGTVASVTPTQSDAKFSDVKEREYKVSSKTTNTDTHEVYTHETHTHWYQDSEFVTAALVLIMAVSMLIIVSN